MWRRGARQTSLARACKPKRIPPLSFASPVCTQSSMASDWRHLQEVERALSLKTSVYEPGFVSLRLQLQAAEATGEQGGSSEGGDAEMAVAE